MIQIDNPKLAIWKSWKHSDIIKKCISIFLDNTNFLINEILLIFFILKEK